MITIKAIGHDKRSATRQLCEDYLGRCRRKTQLITQEFKGDTKTEQQWLRNNIPDQAVIIALDSTGKTQSSEQFAMFLERNLDNAKPIFCLIGGSHGLCDQVKQRANLLLSFGGITLPHLLARVILCEQLYRAECISNNHPYHK